MRKLGTAASISQTGGLIPVVLQANFQEERERSFSPMENHETMGKSAQHSINLNPQRGPKV